MLVAWLVSLVAALFSAAPSGPERAESGFDCIQPDVAASGRDVILVCGRGRSVLWSRSRDSGVTFGPLRLVETVPGLALGMHRGPRVAMAGHAIVVAAIVQTGRDAPGDLVAWRSADAGTTWTRSAPLNSVPMAAREGLHALAASDDTVVVAWLDLREDGTTLRGRLSRDGGRTWESDRLLYRSPSGSICQCCHPSLLASADGTFAALFRNERDGHRDMYVVESSGASGRVGRGTWAVEACPMDGGDFVSTAEGSWVSVWRRQTSIFMARGRGAEERVAEGRDPTVASGPDGTYIAWTGTDGLLLRRPGAGRTDVLDRRGSFPALAGSGRTMVAAWQRGNRAVVRPVLHETAESSGAVGVSELPRRATLLY